MDKYNNLEYLKNEIIGSNRHQFIYGKDNVKRKSFVKELDNMFPIKIDCDSPIAVCLNEFGLPNISTSDSILKSDKVAILSREYLFFTIAHQILLKSRENIGFDLLNSKIEKLLMVLNKYSKNPDYPNISNLDELINILAQSKDFYKNYYINYLSGDSEEKNIDDIVLPFLELNFFISHYKRCLNINSHFGIIIDKDQDIALSSIKAINLLVGSRINKDISMKIVVEPGKWDSFVAPNGQFVEAVHDYGIVELDNSQSEYIKKLKNMF